MTHESQIKIRTPRVDDNVFDAVTTKDKEGRQVQTTRLFAICGLSEKPTFLLPRFFLSSISLS